MTHFSNSRIINLLEKSHQVVQLKLFAQIEMESIKENSRSIFKNGVSQTKSLIYISKSKIEKQQNSTVS